ncbi:MAG: hypothetical protein KGR26_07540, partial [Cyanobacteria bacterium REEB65]|nr:hypothetical protein [Cyanobacteria bacterium REEB65]
MHAFEVESVAEAGGDQVLDIKVLPDRAHYCLSHKGVAMEISILTGEPCRDRAAEGPAAKLSAKPDIRVEDQAFCRRYIGRYAELGGTVRAVPHVRPLLEAIGERAISPLVDAANFVMFDVGQPLHAFDADLVEGPMVVRAARKGERIALLDSSSGAGREVELIETDHVIVDDLGPLAIAGVKGGRRAGITGATRRVIIESANFDPAAVRRTAARLDLRSESSKRFENEITPELAAHGMAEISALMAEAFPEAAFSPVVDAYPVKAERTVMAFDPSLIESRLGAAVPLERAKGILSSMGIGVEEAGG